MVLKRLRPAWVAPLVALLAAGCLASDASERVTPSGGASPAAASLRFAYLATAPSDDPLSMPAFSAASLALRVASDAGEPSAILDRIELPLDAGSLSDALYGYDAAILGPGVSRRDAEAIATAVSASGIPTVSLSGGPPTDLYVFSPGRGGLAEAMAAAAGREACIAWGSGGEALARALSRYIGGRSDDRGDPIRVGDDEGEAERAAAELLASDCAAVLWSGPPMVGGALRSALAATGAEDEPFVGTDALRDADFLEAAGRSAEGATIVSGARDVSTGLRLQIRRFIQDYQSEVGSPPQPFAVEGWDAANLLLRVLDTGVSEIDAWEGLAGRYELGDDAVPPAFSYVFRGHRWVLRTS